MKAKKKILIARRHKKVRSRISGTTARPRLAVSRSAAHIFAQIIDDEKKITLVGLSTAKVKVTDAGERKGKTAESYALGKEIAVQAIKKGVEYIVFDRGGFLYHGRIKAVAEGARDGGLKF